MKPQVWNRHTRLLSDPLLRCSELLLDVVLQLRQLTGVHFLGSTWTEKIKEIFWLGRQEQKYDPYMSNWQSRFSCAAGLRAPVRQVPDQPQVREGQDSKNSNRWNWTSLVFKTGSFHFQRCFFVFVGKNSRVSGKGATEKAERQISVPTDLQLLPASLWEEFFSFC